MMAINLHADRVICIMQIKKIYMETHSRHKAAWILNWMVFQITIINKIKLNKIVLKVMVMKGA